MTRPGPRPAYARVAAAGCCRKVSFVYGGGAVSRRAPPFCFPAPGGAMLPHDGGAGGGRGRCTCLPAAVVPRRAGPAGLRPGCFMRGPRGLKKPYTAGADAPPLRPGPANRPVSGRHTGRSAAQYGPFRSLLRPVCQCAVGQGVAPPRRRRGLFLQKMNVRILPTAVGLKGLEGVVC